MKKKDKYIVTSYDSFSHEDYTVGEFDTFKEADEAAQKEGGVMNLGYVFYQGKQMRKYGSY